MGLSEFFGVLTTSFTSIIFYETGKVIFRRYVDKKVNMALKAFEYRIKRRKARA
jgi:hypothetical protein